MAYNQKGKLFMLYLLFLFASPYASSFLVKSESSSIQDDNDKNPYHEPVSESEPTNDVNQQVLLINQLEELVRNLTEIVTRLESKLLEPSKMASVGERSGIQEKDKVAQRMHDGKRSLEEVQEDGFGGKIRDGERAKGVLVTKYSPFWSERFQFVSAVKLDSDATCIHVLPFRDYEGLSKYVAVGDERGRVYVFLRNGDALVEFYTLSKSPITAMVSYLSVYKNESVLVTGHRNGAILMHRIWEGTSGEDWNSLVMENVDKFVASDQSEEDGSPITILEVHHVGRMRYILSTDSSGKIRVFRENGTVYGSAMPTSKPLAFLKQRLMFLTETGAGSLDLRSMKVRESECEGLNHSLARNYVFDAAERSKAYGFTSEGDLIHLLLLGDIMNFKCRVRSKKKFDMDEPLVLQAIKGYLLIVSQEKVLLYNVSSQHYARVGAPRLLFSSSLDEIRSSFLNYPMMDLDAEKTNVIPLIVSDREKLVILGLGGGYVGMYASKLPIFKNESNTMLWTSPVLFFILFLFGAWHFFAKKKEALTSWGPDDPFTSTSATTGAPLGTGSGDRSLVDSSRSADATELRSGGLRAPSRRYPSPTRYPGGTSSFRPSSTDHNSRPSSVDPDFRTSELKYRGSSIEPSGFPKRRDNMFVSNQIVDDRN
ncbi:WD40-repeat-containing domain protein [Quillaja saponaria]|uniref:WD40-repeat-containing domain protein n=1 Tax=Quillaja saponaria TaxID=32244 RepID=A0AAD7M078_QUISA|nr:WD40-repeat-containing domain protein [Quillaja saponaria]